MKQAGIAAAVGKFDSVSSHLNDTVQVGGIVDQKIAELVMGISPDRVNDPISLGGPIDVDENQELILRKEAAREHNRIVSVRGDMTGKKIMEVLTGLVENHLTLR